MVKIEMSLFAMEEDESPHALFTRLNNLVLALKGYNCEWCDDAFVVSKFLGAIIPTHSTMVFSIQQRIDYTSLSPNDVLSIFVTHENMTKTIEKMRANARGAKKNNNLALKAKQKQVTSEEEEVDQGSDAAHQFHEEMALLVKKYWGTMGKKGQG